MIPCNQLIGMLPGNSRKLRNGRGPHPNFINGPMESRPNFYFVFCLDDECDGWSDNEVSFLYSFILYTYLFYYVFFCFLHHASLKFSWLFLETINLPWFIFFIFLELLHFPLDSSRFPAGAGGPKVDPSCVLFWKRRVNILATNPFFPVPAVKDICFLTWKAME